MPPALVLPSLLLSVSLAIAETTFFGFGSTTPADVPRQEFNVYWNVPTFMCHKYGLHFEEVSGNYSILQNRNDQFRGDQIAILYDPGMFPAILKDPNGRVVLRNGGVPQEGNLTKHLELLREHLISQIPNQSFNGIGVIDFESWRPIFRQNWASLSLYKDLSIELVRRKHPFWSKNSIELEAKRSFEKYGKLFMQETLKLAKEYRPCATWGYYAYPYCYNLTPHQPNSHCDRMTMMENDKMTWLFEHEDVILPSVYLRENLTEEERVGLVSGRVKEALRIARSAPSRVKILPYYWYKYQDQRDKYLNSTDLEVTLRKISDLGADGLIIWGSSDDINTREKCQQLNEYLANVLGPIVTRIKQTAAGNETRYKSEDLLDNQINVDVQVL